MGILQCELQPQVVIQPEMIEIREVPHPSESLQILSTDEHTEAPSLFGKRSCWSIDEDPEMEVIKSRRFLASGHARDFTFTSDMVDRFWPWSGDFDKDIVLKDLLGFSMDLMVYEEDIQMIFVTARLIGIEGWTSGICGT